MISLNLQSTDTSNRSLTAASSSKPKALGFSDALRKQPVPTTNTDDTASPHDSKPDDQGSGDKYVERPLMWDELDEADAMLDLSGRPAELQKIVDLHAGYVQHRQGSLVDDVWKRIEEMKAQSVKS